MPEVRRQKRPGYSWDEYPFASTIEGGWGAFMSRVPKEEQQYQAGVLGPFMKNLRPGERFQVNLINIPESLTTLP